jgi:hypothetical protein
MFATAFGLAMGLAFGATWLILDRALTSRAVAACLTIVAASSVSAGIALLADGIIRRRAWTARFAVALLILITGTGALTSFFIGAETAWTTHALMELSPKLVIIVVLLTSLGSLYSFLSVAGFLLLPIGIPVIIASAALIANKAGVIRRSSDPGGAPRMEQP